MICVAPIHRSITGQAAHTWLSAALVVTVLAGCGDKPAAPNTVEVTGAVTFDGAPLPKGVIVFDPADGKGRSALGEVVEGKFRCACEPGPKKVAITASRETGRKDEYGGPVFESFIPRQYNTQSRLTTDIPKTAPPPLSFDLSSKAK